MNPTYFHLLSLVRTRDRRALMNFLADVRNIRRLRTRALRLGRWGLLSLLSRRLVDVTIRTLTRVRSMVLLNALVKIFEELLPNLLTYFEQRLLMNMENIKATLTKLAEESRNLYIHRLARDEDYIYSEALKLTIAEGTGAGVVYSL